MTGNGKYWWRMWWWKVIVGIVIVAKASGAKVKVMKTIDIDTRPRRRPCLWWKRWWWGRENRGTHEGSPFLLSHPPTLFHLFPLFRKFSIISFFVSLPYLLSLSLLRILSWTFSSSSFPLTSIHNFVFSIFSFLLPLVTFHNCVTELHYSSFPYSSSCTSTPVLFLLIPSFLFQIFSVYLNKVHCSIAYVFCTTSKTYEKHPRQYEKKGII